MVPQRQLRREPVTSLLLRRYLPGSPILVLLLGEKILEDVAPPQIPVDQEEPQVASGTSFHPPTELHWFLKQRRAWPGYRPFTCVRDGGTCTR